MALVATQVAYYKRKKYIAGFNYQEAEVNIFSLNETRKGVNKHLVVEGEKYGSIGKGSLEFYEQDENGEPVEYIYFNQDGLYTNAAGNYTSLIKIKADGSVERTEIPTAGQHGDIRRAGDNQPVRRLRRPKRRLTIRRQRRIKKCLRNKRHRSPWLLPAHTSLP